MTEYAATIAVPDVIPQCGIMPPGRPSGLCLYSKMPLARGHLGDLDLDPKLDLCQHGIELRMARTELEMGGGRLQLGQGSL
jgi:hypothetical protein